MLQHGNAHIVTKPQRLAICTHTRIPFIEVGQCNTGVLRNGNACIAVNNLFKGLATRYHDILNRGRGRYPVSILCRGGLQCCAGRCGINANDTDADVII